MSSSLPRSQRGIGLWLTTIILRFESVHDEYTCTDNSQEIHESYGNDDFGERNTAIL